MNLTRKPESCCLDVYNINSLFPVQIYLKQTIYIQYDFIMISYDFD